jgi:hypothetical protein
MSRPKKPPRLPDGRPNLTDSQRAGLEIEVKLHRASEHTLRSTRVATVRPWPKSVNGAQVARKIGVSEQLVSRWRSDAYYQEEFRRLNGEDSNVLKLIQRLAAVDRAKTQERTREANQRKMRLIGVDGNEDARFMKILQFVLANKPVGDFSNPLDKSRDPAKARRYRDLMRYARRLANAGVAIDVSTSADIDAWVKQKAIALPSQPKTGRAKRRQLQKQLRLLARVSPLK